jgi:hypothetical protein
MDYSIVGLIGSFSFGYIFSSFVRKVIDKISDENASKKINLVYSKLLENVYGNRTVFTSRINNTISLETLIEGEGKVNIMYMMDKKDIALFKNDKCIYTSDLVKVDLLDEIVNAIDIQHKDKILDTVNMMGLIFSREDFEKKFNMKVEDMKKGMMYGPPMEIYDIDKMINDDEIDFDIDYILDRISEVGIENLTPDEKEFLDNYNNN